MQRVFPSCSGRECASHLTNPTDIINHRQRAWLNVGRTRMVLFDLLHGFHSIRKVVQEEVGGNANYLIFQAGIKGGYSFLVPMIRGGRINPGPRGFINALSMYTHAGFGDFQMQEMDWKRGWGRVTCYGSLDQTRYRGR